MRNSKISNGVLRVVAVNRQREFSEYPIAVIQSSSDDFDVSPLQLQLEETFISNVVLFIREVGVLECPNFSSAEFHSKVTDVINKSPV